MPTTLPAADLPSTCTAPGPRSRRSLAAAVVAVVVGGLVAVGPSPAGAYSSQDWLPDVPRSAFFEDPVRWLVAEGHTTGVGTTGLFQPRRDITRGEVATFLWRVAGRPSVSRSGPPPFTDVPRGAYFEVPVRWLAAEGHTTGVDGTSVFQPGRSITRGEVATFLWRVAGRPGAPGSGAPFPDVPAGAFFADAVRWLAAERHTTGVGRTGQFQPRRSITRGEVATFLWRVEGRPRVAGPLTIASFSTPLQPGQARNHNIRLAGRYFDRRTVAPGATFSLDQAIGPRSAARGFRPNGVIVDGSVESTVGGGVSQVATTVLNAAWFAGVRIDEARPHTIYLTRYPMCREATIIAGQLDMRWTNDTPWPITVRAFSDATSFTVALVGIPWASVTSSIGAPYNVAGPGGAFSVDCQRTVTFPNGATATDNFTWRYRSGFPG